MSGHTETRLVESLQGAIDFSDKFNGIAKIDVSLLNECVAALHSHAELVKALEGAEAAYKALIGRAGYQTYQALEDAATKLRQEALATLTARKMG